MDKKNIKKEKVKEKQKVKTEDKKIENKVVKEIRKEKVLLPGQKPIVPVKAVPAIAAKPAKLISFDVFFSMAMRQKKDIRAYHKIPMKIFFEKHLGLQATKEEFNKILDKY